MDYQNDHIQLPGKVTVLGKQRHSKEDLKPQLDNPINLIKNTLEEFADKNRYAKKCSSNKPADLAALQQKAFQQFDLIIDAEKDLSRKMVTLSQVEFTKDQNSPRMHSQSLAHYSTINADASQEQYKRIMNQEEGWASIPRHKSTVPEQRKLTDKSNKQRFIDRKIC